MLIDEHQLTVEDIESVVSIDDIIGLNVATSCLELYEHCRTVGETAVGIQKGINGFIGSICHIRLDSADARCPFKELCRNGNFRTTSIEDIEREDIAALALLLGKTQNVLLLARINDLMWVAGKDYKAAIRAVEYYLQQAHLIADDPQWSEYFRNMERAYRITLLIKHKELYRSVVDELLKACDRPISEEYPYLIQKIISLLIENADKSVDVLRELKVGLEKAAVRAGKQGAFLSAADAWTVLARLHRVLKEEPNVVDALRSTAESLVQYAELLATPPATGQLVAASIVEDALELYAQIPNCAQRISELEKLLLGYRQSGILSMQMYEHTVDLTDSIREVEEKIADYNPFQLMVFLVVNLESMSPSDLDESIKQNSESVITRLFNRQMIDSKGKKVADIAPLGDQKRFTKQSMLEAAAIRWQFVVKVLIYPVLRAYAKMIDIDLRFIRLHLVNNRFIEADHVEIYNRGLLEGFKGDFLVASHILVPQIENSFRYLLNSMDFHTTRRNDDGVEEEMEINTILNNSELNEALCSVLGKGVMIDLESLLIGRVGENMRNRLAHGLLPDSYFYRGEAPVYLWAITLRICIAMSEHCEVDLLGISE